MPPVERLQPTELRFGPAVEVQVRVEDVAPAFAALDFCSGKDDLRDPVPLLVKLLRDDEHDIFNQGPAAALPIRV